MDTDSKGRSDSHLDGDPTVVRLAAEMVHQWKAGIRRPAEQYLARAGRLSDGEAVELILVEFFLRRKRGEAPTAEEYATRFPRLAEPLVAELRRLEQRLLDPTVQEPRRPREDQSPTGVWPDATVLNGDAHWEHAAERRPSESADDLAPTDDGMVRESTQRDEMNDRELRETAELDAADAAGTAPWGNADQNYVLVSPVEPVGSTDPVERYRLTKLHARGGVGQVWLARDAVMGREVALKELRPDRRSGSQVMRERFVEEAKITGQLEHPGIVPVYELARRESDKTPFYTMRFVQGRTLHRASLEYHERRKRGEAGRLELDELLQAFIGVCNAIAYAHSRGVIHRDLKGDNIVLGEFGEVIVLDWGLAKLVTRDDTPVEPSRLLSLERSGSFEETGQGEVVGTPQYIPPEQAQARHDLVGPRSDVYGLGAILYEIITGRAPFGGRSVREVLDRVIADEPAPPMRHHPELSPALQAICLKAMAKNPTERYATAALLAQEVRRYLSDEPVSAYPEPFLKRIRRWANRHRVLVNSMAAALLIGLAAGGYLLYDARLRFAERLTAAIGRVDALASAEIRAVPQIVKQLAPDRELVNDRLAKIARGEGGPGTNRRARLAAGLALLEQDPAQEAILAAAAVAPDTPPDQLLVIATAISGRPGAQALAARLAGELTQNDQDFSDRQLRSAGLLAWTAPTSDAWKAIAARTARKLAAENVLRIGDWRDVFVPVARSLVEPLRLIEGDRAHPEARDRALTLLLDFALIPGNRERPEDLAALAVEADPDRLNRIIALLPTADERDRAARWLNAHLGGPPVLDAIAAGRQARITLALARLGREEALRATLTFRPDPSARTDVIHQMALYGIDAGSVTRLLRAETDSSVRRALVLALGEYPENSVNGADRGALITLLEGWYKTDPDAGLHGAVAWLLRNRFGRGDALDAIDRSLASREIPANRGWFVDKRGETFTVIRGPVTFTIGSPPGTAPKQFQPEETSHLRRIPRSFAMAAREVTTAEYVRFLNTKPRGVVDRRDDPQYSRVFPSTKCAAGDMTWYEAIRFCNWVSELEGIPKNEWCYPDNIGPEMVLEPAHLDRLGYRLATEVEWEFACRAGTTSSRFLGNSASALKYYAWCAGENRAGIIGLGAAMSPVGLLKPNDFGLFDMLGNAMEWCDGPFLQYPKAGLDQPLNDVANEPDHPEVTQRALRGGMFFFPPDNVRSPSRFAEKAMQTAMVLGIRLARTIPAER
jgi:serine/threonine protein kinase/formylglycine-generating enzyme required for sulfatase activity